MSISNVAARRFITGASKRNRAGTAVVAIAAATFLPATFPPYVLNILTLAAIISVAAVGLDLLMGYTGLESLGQAAFYGVAAYGIGILTVQYSYNWYLAALLAIGLALVLAAVFGLAAVRLGGLYFLLITLAFGQVLWGGVQRWGSVTGGFNGLSGVPMPADFFIDPIHFWYLAIGVLLIAVVAARVIVGSEFGLGLKGCRDNEVKLQSMGFQPFWLKWLAFVLAAGYAAVAGILNASYNSFVSPSEMSLQLSFAIMLMVIIGGGGYVYGAVVGAIIITSLQYGLSVYLENWWLLVMGALYALAALLVPQGIFGSRRVRGLFAKPSPERVAVSADQHARLPQPSDAPGYGDAQGTVLQLTGISRRFGGFQALDNVTLDFQAGERTAIIGPNGAGKTTLFNVISGIHAPTAGAIVVAGHDLTKRTPDARPLVGLSRTFQIAKVFTPLTVLENMLIALIGASPRRRHYRMWRRVPASLREQAFSELERAGLAAVAHNAVRDLSYGHQKQLEIALALAARPKLLLLDEPTAGLSQGEADDMMSLVQALPAEITVLIIEHNLDIVFRLTDRLVVLDHGQVLVDGPQDVVRGSDEVRRIYFGSRA